ncbi:MAG: hypothetical protein EOO07_23975, partial [Chitinophagaceae bacterium]
MLENYKEANNLSIKASAYKDSVYNINLEVIKKIDKDNYTRVYVDKARRFHNTYSSGMGEVEVGFEKTKWVDLLTFGLTYSQNKNQLQTGVSVNTVYGGKWTENHYLMPSIKFRKDNFLTKGLYANMYVNYSDSRNLNRDTALHRYDWSGNWQANSTDTSFVEQQFEKFNDKSFVGRANFNYSLDEEQNNSLNLNYTFSTTDRKTYDLTEAADRQDRSGLPKRLGKHIVGLAWQSQWFQKRLISVATVKYYAMQMMATIDKRPRDVYGAPIGNDFITTNSFFGYPSASVAVRYRLVADLGIKASVERGYNLPEVTGIFGDGQTVSANLDLKPERSDNFNFGAYFNHFFGDHYINLDASAFYRDYKDYVSSRIDTSDKSNSKSISVNIPGVKSSGMEAEAKYGYKDMLQISGNFSYNKVVNSEKYSDASHSQIDASYNKQIPNQPWIYGNASVMLAKRDLIGKGTRLQFNYSYQFVHWFYL